MGEVFKERESEADVDITFIERWSPRAFSSKSVDEKLLLSLFEAAKWSPSAFNEQPWLFLYAQKEEDLKTFRSLLFEKNQMWANKAPVLAFICAKKYFTHNGKINDWSEFDCGSAWMALALQANKLGLKTHAMAGFDAESAYSKLNVSPDEYRIIAAVAIGYEGNISELPLEFQEREKLTLRKSLKDITREGRFSL